MTCACRENTIIHVTKMPSCVLRYCNNYSRKVKKTDGITFHRFLRAGHEKRESWIKYVQDNRKEDTWLPSLNTYICSAHFKESDKYRSKTGRLFLRKSAVPCDNPSETVDPSSLDIEPISDSVSESNSIFDSPEKIDLKNMLRRECAAKQKLKKKVQKLQRKNRYLRQKMAYYKLIVQQVKQKFGLQLKNANDLTSEAEAGTRSSQKMLSDFEKEKVYWTRKMNLKLVNYMRSKPHIWNPKHPKYTSIKMRDHTYGQFAAMYDNQFSGKAVKERWTNIRSTFASYLRKVNNADRDNEAYQVNWHLWDACQFLLKVTKSTKDNKETSQVEELCTNDDDMNSISDETEYHSDNDNTSCNAIANDLVTLFKGIQNDAFGLDNSRNGKIGCSVAKTLSQMNSYEAAKLSTQIMEVLLKYEAINSSVVIQY